MSNDLIDYWGKFHDGTPSIHRPWLPYQSRITLLLSLSHLILLFRAAFRKVLLVISLQIGFLRAFTKLIGSTWPRRMWGWEEGDRGSSNCNSSPRCAGLVCHFYSLYFLVNSLKWHGAMTRAITVCPGYKQLGGERGERCPLEESSASYGFSATRLRGTKFSHHSTQLHSLSVTPLVLFQYIVIIPWDIYEYVINFGTKSSHQSTTELSECGSWFIWL